VHIEPHLVAGDAAIMAWHDDTVLNKAAAMQIGRVLDHPRVVFGTEVTLPVKRNDGAPERYERTGRPLRKPAHVWHCSLSLAPSEGPLSDGQWAAISEEFVARRASPTWSATCRRVDGPRSVTASRGPGWQIHRGAAAYPC
jgi:hypothetical protein